MEGSGSCCIDGIPLCMKKNKHIPLEIWVITSFLTF